MLKLEAKNKNEEIILNYLNQNASESLAEKINNGKKTLSQCWNYIVAEAKKEAVNNCACIDSDTVFGWAVHFFEEDSIQAEEQKPIPVKTVATKPKPEPKKPQDEMVQLCLFDM